MLDLTDDWVWDFWTATDGPETHLFFLCAPRSLVDPDLRHWQARVGHAVSRDLVSWRLLPDALVPQPAPAYDDLATWTGSVVQDQDGTWWMFTSGVSSAESGRVQRFGAATSPDLTTWTRVPGLVVEADPRWYAVLDPRPGSGLGPGRPEEHWRDPFVVPGADGWHLYATAQAPPGSSPPGNGVLAHATSPDLRTWTVRPPLSAPTGRFDQLEVPRLRVVGGRWVLLFSCRGAEMPLAGPGAGGVWTVPVAGPGAPVEVAAAVRLADERLYVGDVVDGPDGPVLLAFGHDDDQGSFVGGLIDPLPVRWRADGRGLELCRGADRVDANVYNRVAHT